MTTFDELIQITDDIVTRLDDNDMSLSDFSDSIDTGFQDLQDIVDELQSNEGQLAFPLTQETIDLITEQAPAMLKHLWDYNYINTVVLVAGTVTVANQLITANSIVMLSRLGAGGTLGNLSYTTSAGSLVITSSSGTDTSSIIYFILVP